MITNGGVIQDSIWLIEAKKGGCPLAIEVGNEHGGVFQLLARTLVVFLMSLRHHPRGHRSITPP